MAHNDQDHSSYNLPQETLGNSRVEATADIQEMQTDEPQQPSSDPPQYSEVVAGPSSTFPPVASSHTEQGPADEMPPLIALSDDEESQSPQADASTSRAPNTRRARVEDEEDEDEQRESNRQRITSPGAGSDADADHHYHPDIHTHAQEREQQQQQQQQPEGAPPTFHHMAFTLDWFPISLNPAPGARPAGANAGLPPLQTAFGNFGFDLAPHTHDVPVNLTGAAPAQQQQQQDHPNPQPQPHPDAPPAAQNGASPAFFDLMRHLRDTIGGIQFGPDGTPANLPPGVHIHTGPPIFPPFGPMMGGMDFQEPDDPVRAMKLLKGLEEVSPGLLKRMERVAQEDQETPVCAVCFDSLLEPAVEDEAQSSSEQPADSDVPMDVDAESTASNDPAISSTASTSGSTVTSTSSSTSSASTETTTPTTPPVDTSLDHKVFVLPCAHAFHGSCLRPWFTRPHRTTCPTCRFDVDPESLTYVAPPPGAQMDRIRQLFARAQRARAAANANGGGNANAAPAPAAAATNTNADAAPPLPFPLDLPQLPQLVDPRLLDPDDEITIIPIERVPAGSNAPLGGAAGNATPPAANAQPTGNAQPNANTTGGGGGFPAGMPPIGIILDFSLVFPPGARPAPPQPAGAQPAAQVPQPAGPQAQQDAGGPQPQPGAGVQGGQNALPPASQRILDRVVNMRGQNGVTPASQRIIEQVVRGILSALAGPLPPPPAPPVPSTPVNPTTGAGANDAPPAERANSPPAASAASARAASEPPMGSPPPPPPPFMSFGGGGPLPAFGASIPVNALGPLPSFNEFVQLVQGGDNATGQAGGRTGAPEPPQPQEQVPRQGEGQPPNEGEQGQGQAPPGYSDFLHNIQHMVSNTMHRILTRPGAPHQDAHAPAPPQGTAPIPPHPPTAQQARPPQPPGPIPLHVPPPLAVPLPHAHHHHHHHHHPPRPAGPKREWTVPPPPGPTLRARVERKERELGLRCWDVSCGLGPTDEDPVPGVDARGVRQVYIKPLRSSTPAPHPTPNANENKEGEEERVCEHSFHPACLVSAERVAGWNGADQKKDLEREGEEREVQVSCPVCRAVGVISREDWDEGACALA